MTPEDTLSSEAETTEVDEPENEQEPDNDLKVPVTPEILCLVVQDGVSVVVFSTNKQFNIDYPIKRVCTCTSTGHRVDLKFPDNPGFHMWTGKRLRLNRRGHALIAESEGEFRKAEITDFIRYGLCEGQPSFDPNSQIVFPLDLPLEQVERMYIDRVIQKFENNRTAAARALKITARTIANRRGNKK